MKENIQSKSSLSLDKIANGWLVTLSIEPPTERGEIMTKKIIGMVGDIIGEIPRLREYGPEEIEKLYKKMASVLDDKDHESAVKTLGPKVNMYFFPELPLALDWIKENVQ